MESGLGRGRGGDGGCSSRWSPGHATQAGPVRMAVMLPAQCRSATRKRASGPALSATVPGTVPLPGRPEPQAVSAASHAQSSRPPTESARGRVAGDPSLPQGQRRSPPRRCHGQSQSRASRGGSETRTESAAAAGARRPGGGPGRRAGGSQSIMRLSSSRGRGRCSCQAPGVKLPVRASDHDDQRVRVCRGGRPEQGELTGREPCSD